MKARQHRYSRREVLAAVGIGAATCALPCGPSSAAADPKKTHFITLSFDDGFKKSSLRTAEIFEKHKLLPRQPWKSGWPAR
jgi:hypothetical protein